MDSPDLRSALPPVLNRNERKWLRYILAVVRNEADAEDVIQEAISRVLARNVPMGSEDHIRMYLGRAIGNAALEAYKRRKRERMRYIPLKDRFQVPAPVPTPFACMEEKERSGQQEKMLLLIEQGLKLLPEKQYEAVRLTILESDGLSIRDVGSTSGIPYSTLRHRTRQGLKSLKKYVERGVRSQETGDRRSKKLSRPEID